MADLDLVIFDCDGTLVDSEFLASQIESEHIRAAGYEISAEDHSERFAGMATKDTLMEIEREANIPLQASLLDQITNDLDKRIPLDVEAIAETHEALSKIDVPMCICSNSPQVRLEAMLLKTHLASFFGDKVYSSREVGNKQPKPDPSVFLHAIDVLDAEADFTFVIEDSEHGIKSAKAAGARVIGFTGASHSFPGHAERLMDAGAETVINRYKDLPGTLEALAAWKDLK